MENKEAAVRSSLARVAINRIRDIEWLVADFSNEVAFDYNIKENIRIRVQLNHRVESDNKLAFIRAIISYDLPIDGDMKPALRYIADVVFEIDNFSDVFKLHEDGEYEVPNQFLLNLSSIALSTVRGTMAAKTASTYLMDVYLPILTPADIVKILGL